MEVAVVCRFNQARSIIGAAAIRKFFPGVEVISSGIEAISGGALPMSVREIARQWDLPIFEQSSTSLSDAHEQLERADLIIAADGFVAARLEDLFPNTEVRNLQESLTALEFTPHDPSGMSGVQTQIELAKVVAITVQIIQSLVSPKGHFPITAFIPRTPLAESEAVAQSLSENPNGFQIDLNLRSPDPSLWRKTGLTVRRFGNDVVGDLQATVRNSEPAPVALASPFEQMWPEKVWTSPDLFRLIHQLAQRAPVSLVTAPLGVEGRLSPDAFLASIAATSVSLT